MVVILSNVVMLLFVLVWFVMLVGKRCRMIVVFMRFVILIRFVVSWVSSIVEVEFFLMDGS